MLLSCSLFMLPFHALQIRALPFRVLCFTSAYRRADETGKSPWHFILVQISFTTNVSRIDVDSVSLIAGSNPEYATTAETEMARKR
jgi:hypothetical protein